MSPNGVRNIQTRCSAGTAWRAPDATSTRSPATCRYRVICPDLLGRGSSQWAREPTREYRFAFFGQMALELCQQLGIGRMRWVGEVG